MGIDHPDLISTRLTPEQIVDWWAYYQHDPWGEQRADFRSFFAARAAYVESAVPEYPYVDPGFSVEELMEATGNG